MCFGSKEKQLYNEHDEAPRPAPGHFPQQPTYADPAPKASMPQRMDQKLQPQQQPHQPSPVSPVSPQHHVPPARPPPAELSSVAQSNPPAELSSDYAPPAGPPPSHRNNNSDEFAPPAGPPPSHTNNDYGPPSGPPPSHANNDFAPPSGPPPSHANNDYAPPSGPPPSHAKDDYAPPPGPPPSKGDYAAPPSGAPPSTKKLEPWEIAVPDTSLFPPPPAIFSGFYQSPTSNATEGESEVGESWCAQYPLQAPLKLDPAALHALQTHNLNLMTPNSAGYKGSLTCVGPGIWNGATDSSSTDSCILAYPPLYSVNEHSPLIPHGPGIKTIYYEVLVQPAANAFNPFSSSATAPVNLALGFTALPYPSFRMPGWHRGSLAVHGDDGHKYINDTWGGKEFTSPFRRGETYGIGITFQRGEGGNDQPLIKAQVFFTRQGQRTQEWDLHEEIDSHQDRPVTGLEGFNDLSLAIGTYQDVAFQVVLDPGRWLYRPEGI